MLFGKLAGTIGNIFRIGDVASTTSAIQDLGGDGLSIVDFTGVSRRVLQLARPHTAVAVGLDKDTLATTLKDLKENNLLLIDGFDGATPPVPGIATNGYYICHTAGGIYDVGQIWECTQLALTQIGSQYRGMLATSMADFSGTLVWNAGELFICVSIAGPSYSWSMVGLSPPVYSGLNRSILIPISAADWAAPFYKDSTTQIPAGAFVVRSSVRITSSTFDNDPVIDAQVYHAVTPTVIRSSADQNMGAGRDDQFDVFDDIEALATGTVRVTFSGTTAPTVGNAMLIVEFVEPLS